MTHGGLTVGSSGETVLFVHSMFLGRLAPLKLEYRQGFQAQKSRH